MKEEAQACIEHFSPYVKWRGVAIEQDFQALTLAEGWVEIRAHEARRSSKDVGDPELPSLRLP